MPYHGITDPKLPPSVRKLPKALREVWVRVFNENYDEADEGKAFKIAWGAVRKIQGAKEARAMIPTIDMDDVRAWLVNDKASKTDGGDKFESTAYLYCPDKEKPSTWKLRIEETPGKVTIAQLGRAAAALGPGYRGNHVDMPAEDKKMAARKLIGMYRKHDVMDSDIPNHLWDMADMSQRRPNGAKQAVLGAGFKAVKQEDGSTRWFMLSSGAFEDRDGEIMSQAFIESALEFAEKTQQRGTLNIWHVPHSDIGTCDFQALVGNPGVLIESGLFDDTPAGQRAAAYYGEHGSEQGGSIEFAWKYQTPDGVYTAPGVIVRRSILPMQRAAFPWSALVVKENEMAKRRAEVVTEFARVLNVSEEAAEQVLEHLESGANDLKEYGVRWKEAAADETPAAAEVAPTTEAVAEQAQETPAAEPAAAVEAVQVETTLEQTAEPLEVVITPDTLATIVAQAVAAVQPTLSALEAKINEIAQTILTMGQQQLSVATASKELQDTVAALKAADDDKIAAQVRNLPRATVKGLAATAQRPSQRTPDAELVAQAANEDSMLERARKTLYG